MVNSYYNDFIGDWFCIFYATRLASKTGGHFFIQSEPEPDLWLACTNVPSLCISYIHFFWVWCGLLDCLNETPLFGYSDYLGFGFVTLIKPLYKNVSQSNDTSKLFLKLHIQPYTISASVYLQFPWQGVFLLPHRSWWDVCKFN